MWALALAGAVVLASTSLSLAADLPAYEGADPDLAGSIASAGSDTLRPVIEAWSEAFTDLHSEVEITIESLGSATAPPALTSGASTIAPMSRPMTAEEIAGFESVHGFAPVAVAVALDALAVYVNENNPIHGLTVQQLDRVFSSSHDCGGSDITRWDQIAVGVSSRREIELHGRNELSGTYESFRRDALCGGAFKDSVVLHEDSQAVVEAIAADVDAIGYSGLGYRMPGVRALAIGLGAVDEETRYFPYVVGKYADSPDPELRHAYVFSGQYPLARPLLIYVAKKPGESLPAEVDAFLRFTLSREGQAIVETVGYVPLSARMVLDERAKLEPDYRPRKRWWSALVPD